MSNEPKPVIFPATPSPGVVVQPKATPVREARDEPKAVSFSATPSATPKPSFPNKQHREPGAVVFPPAGPLKKDVSTTSVDAQPNKGSENAPLRAVHPGGPTPLVFPASAPTPPAMPSAAPKPLFGSQEHPLLDAALREANSLSPELAHAETERLLRYLRKLLPLTVETVEDWGSHCLEECRKITLATADASQRFSALKSSQVVEGLLKASEPAVSFVEKARRKFGDTVEQRIARANHLVVQLKAARPDIERIKKEAVDEGTRLAVLVLALRACTQAAGTPSSELEQALNQRLGTMRAALTQASLLPEQLRAVADLITVQVQQLDRLLNVTLTAEKLAQSAQAI